MRHHISAKIHPETIAVSYQQALTLQRCGWTQQTVYAWTACPNPLCEESHHLILTGNMAIEIDMPERRGSIAKLLEWQFAPSLQELLEAMPGTTLTQDGDNFFVARYENHNAIARQDPKAALVSLWELLHEGVKNVG